MSFTPYGLITTFGLHASYKQASDQKLRESATVPFWENLLNKVICAGEDNLFVNSQQPVDETTKSVDIVVQYYDQALTPVIVLMMECKRHNKKAQRNIIDMEEQLEGYMLFYMTEGGFSRTLYVYGAVAYGTKVRAWRFYTKDGRHLDRDWLWGSNQFADQKSYIDPGIPGEAEKISSFLLEAKAFAINKAYNINQTGQLPSVGSANQQFQPYSSEQQVGTSTGAYQTSTPLYGLGGTDIIQPSSTSYGEALGTEILPFSTPFVNVYEKHRDLRFMREDGKEVKTVPSDWKEARIELEGLISPCLVYTGKKSGKRYYTWSLPAN